MHVAPNCSIVGGWVDRQDGPVGGQTEWSIDWHPDMQKHTLAGACTRTTRTRTCAVRGHRHARMYSRCGKYCQNRTPPTFVLPWIDDAVCVRACVRACVRTVTVAWYIVPKGRWLSREDEATTISLSQEDELKAPTEIDDGRVRFCILLTIMY